MPLQVTRDEERRRFSAVGTGTLTADEFLRFMTEHRVGQYRPYALVLDIREATVTMTPGELREIALRAEQLRAREGARGPVAILAERPGVFGLSRIYESLAEVKNLPPLRVFQTEDEADAWLATLEAASTDG